MKTFPIPLSWLFFAGVLAAGGALSAREDAAEMTADEIIQEQNRRHSAESEIEFLSLATIAPDGTTRRNGVLGISRKDENGHLSYLIRLLSPEDVKGVTILVNEGPDREVEHYLYMPAVGKVRKLGLRGKSGYFMGTDFTYEDLLKERSGDYRYERLEDAGVDGASCYVLRARAASAKTRKNTAYAYRDLFIDQESYNILKIDFYGLNGKLLKTLRAYDYHSRLTDGPTMRPRRAEMKHHEKGSVSKIDVLRSRINFPVNPEFFTPEAVENWPPERDQEILLKFNKDQLN